MPFDLKTAKKAGKKSRRGPAIKQQPSIKEKMELLYEKVLDDLLKNQDKLTKTERVFIVSNIKSVDHCVLSIDEDRTVCKTIEKIALDFGNDYELSFANGGDQNNNTIPERPICDQMGINLVDGLGDKIQSSSWLLKK